MGRKVLAIALALAWWFGGAGVAVAERVLETPDDASLVLMEVPRDLTHEEVERLSALVSAALRDEPDSPRWLLAQALLSEHTDKSAVGVTAANAVLRVEPNNAVALYAWGVSTEAVFDAAPSPYPTKRRKVVRDAYARAMELDPSFLPAKYKLIEFHLKTPEFAGGEKDIAEELAKELLAEDDQTYLGHLYLGRLYGLRKDWGRMQRNFALAAASAPTSRDKLDAISGWVWSLHTIKHDNRASAELAMAAAEGEFADEYRMHFLAAESLRELGDYGGALLYYQNVIELEDHVPLSHLGRARCLEKLGEREAALAAYRVVLEKYLEEFGEEDENMKEARAAVERLGGGSG